MNLKSLLTTVLCVVLPATAAPANQNNLNLPIGSIPKKLQPADPGHQEPVFPPPPTNIILPVPSSPDLEPPPQKDLTPEDYIPTYDCDGSIMCNAMNVAWCDDAANFYLTRSDAASYGSSSNATRQGACDGWDGVGCAVFIQGNDDPKCTRTGNQMWWDYQDIRDKGRCNNCGTKHWYPGCMTTVNYVSWCKSDSLDHNTN